MTQSTIKAVPDGIHTVTTHIVVRGAAKAAEKKEEDTHHVAAYS